jgi:hypothetical protein
MHMLWLAPPVLFTAGLGFSWAPNNSSFGSEREREPFIDARVGYPVDQTRTVGLRLRGSHMRTQWYDNLAPRPFDEFHDTFELYTLDVGMFGEIGARRFYGMAWMGVHTAHVDATYNHWTYDDSVSYHARERFITGPAFAAGVALGVNVYNAGRYRVTVYGELAFTSHVFMTNKSLEDDSYRYEPTSLGVAVRF